MQILRNIFQFPSQAAKESISKAKSELQTCLVCPEFLHRLNMELKVESELYPQYVQVEANVTISN